MKKIWFYLCVIQTVIIVGGLLFMILFSKGVPKVEKEDLVAYLSEFSEENNYIPRYGYISDAKTAKRVGSAILDELSGNNFIGFISIVYDEKNHLWMVKKNYLFGDDCFVVIEQDSGKIIKVLFTKN